MVGVLIAALIVALPLSHASSLKTFYLPSSCQSGKTQIVYAGAPEYGYNSSGILKTTKGMSYEPNMDCSFTLLPIGTAFTISVHKTDIRSGCKDTVTISFPGGGAFSLCRNLRPGETISYSGIGPVTVSFRTGSGLVLLKDGFKLVFTAHKRYPCYGPSLFQCSNGNCISKNLKCDGYNHCGDKSDQSSCGLTIGPIVGIALGCFFLLIACISFAVYCFRRERRIIVTGPMYRVQ